MVVASTEGGAEEDATVNEDALGTRELVADEDAEGSALKLAAAGALTAQEGVGRADEVGVDEAVRVEPVEREVSGEALADSDAVDEGVNKLETLELLVKSGDDDAVMLGVGKADGDEDKVAITVASADRDALAVARCEVNS